MAKCSLSLAGSMLLLLSGAAGGLSVSAQAPRTVDGAFASKHYQNLLAGRGHTEAEIDARIEHTFQQLFHGDKQSEAVYFDTGRNSDGPLAYITDWANHDARTEGMSYGMMIAVQTDHKAEFDAIWNWANTYMLITDPENPAVGYFAWSMNTDGTPRSDSPAPDGEEYFVMSLYFAAHRWGNGKGIYDYKAQADRILSLMRHHPVQTGTGPFRIHPGDAAFEPPRRTAAPANTGPRTSTVGPMVSEANHMIVFVPGQGGNGFSDPSYHLPAFYELWARWGPLEDRTFWAACARRSRSYFTESTDQQTGLNPDYTNFDGSPHATPWNPMAANFSYDSWRTVSNWSVDQAWWGENAHARVLSDHIQSFLASQGIHTFADQYTLAGKPLSSRHSVGMVATNAVGSLSATPGKVADAFVDELWATPVPRGEQRYFDGMLYTMSLLHVSGRFRIWQ